jgi:lipopolysaccharide transport system ATP-binding protein
MPDTIIKLENISKQYRLGQVGTQTLRGDLQRWWHTIRGKEDPTLKIGQTNQLNSKLETGNREQGTVNSKLETNYVWALKDINLEVKQGEILGIIGKNGAGKSTLLKLLSRVTAPTTGSIKVKGRIASLLEVGTGFHPELTGRENIFLNGAILGMTKAEIRSKFDEIVDFAGVAKYVDTPVKRYSSGMYVRLAFAVAAHLEPDILVVDEVLAVGDAEFQKKAIGKMQDISTGGGRTVLFVSHNMAIIESLCENTLLLFNGLVQNIGKSSKVVSQYLSLSTNIKRAKATFVQSEKTEIEIHSAILVNEKNEIASVFYNTEQIIIKLFLSVKEENPYYKVGIKIFNENGVFLIQSFHNDMKDMPLKTGTNEVIFELPKNFFNNGEYRIDVVAGIHNIKRIFEVKNALGFTILYKILNDTMQNEKKYSIVAPLLKTSIFYHVE